MSLIDVLNDWREKVLNLRESEEFMDIGFPITVRRTDDTVFIRNNCSLSHKDEKGNYFTAFPEQIPHDLVQQQVEELKKRYPKYKFEIEEPKWFKMEISISGTSEEMSQEIKAIREHYGEPFLEYYL